MLCLLAMKMDSSAQFLIENKGQWPEQVLFRAELGEATIYIEKTGVCLDLVDPAAQAQIAEAHHMHGVTAPDVLKHHAYAVQFLNATPPSSVNSFDPSPGHFSYFLGDDPEHWGKKAKAYRAVKLERIYPGIDISYYFQRGNLKYDLHLASHADPALISFKYTGVTPELREDGTLLIKTSVNDLVEQKPYAYQLIEGKEVAVNCDYVLNGSTLSFELGAYDTSLPLVIDPELKFSTFSGSVSNNFGYTATFDRDGYLYSGSTAFGNAYPTTLGAYNEIWNGGQVDIALSKYDTTGTFMVWSTYIGGSKAELPHSIIVNDQDELFVYGTTGSNNYPTTSGAYDTFFEGGFPYLTDGLGVSFPEGTDIILSKFNYDGSELLASTFVGGNGNDGINREDATNYNYADEIRGEVEFDSEGNVYVASSTVINIAPNDFPTTPGVIMPDPQGGFQDGVIFKMTDDLSSLTWSTYFGGSLEDAAFSIVVNSLGQVIVCGGTNSQNLPTTTGVVQSSFQGGSTDAWVLILNSDASSIISCSYWGSPSYDQAYMVELDSENNVHLFGQTFNGDSFIINAAYANLNSGQFITKLNTDLSAVIWSTTFGNGNGEPNISPTAFLVDLCDRIYLSGWGGPTQGGPLTTAGLPITADAYQSTTDGGDFYLLALADDASSLVYASYFGGDESNEHVDGGTSRFDRKGKVYQSVCAGCQGHSDFPIFPSNAVSSINGSTGCNNGVFKMDFELPAVIADFSYEPICYPDSLHFQNTSLGGLTFTWLFGDGEESNLYSPTHLYPGPGSYEVTLILSDPLSCNLADTLVQSIFIFQENSISLEDIEVCEGTTVQIGIAPLPLPNITYSWTNPGLLDNPFSSSPIATVSSTTTFTLTIDNGICPTQVNQTIAVEAIQLELSNDTLICEGGTALLNAETFGAADSYTWASDPAFTNVLSNTSSLSVSPDMSSTYYLLAEGSCAVEGQVNVSIFNEAISISPNVYICADVPTELSVFSSIPLDGVDIIWSPETHILSGQGTSNILVSSDEEVTFYCTITSAEGCVVEDSILVEISPLSFLTADASSLESSIPLGGSTQLFADPATGYSYQWTPPTGLSNSGSPAPFASPIETTTYTLNIIDSDLNGACQKSDTVTIRVFEFQCAFPLTFVPNAFTPNNDGANDVLYVRGQFIETFDLKIYDRWGELVFETQDKSQGWDGSFKGKELDPAVYVYHMNVVCIDGNSSFEKGNITLIR
jgi:gliding motility-associated-like protein